MDMDQVIVWVVGTLTPVIIGSSLFGGTQGDQDLVLVGHATVAFIHLVEVSS
jgi:hypothetical protein